MLAGANVEKSKELETTISAAEEAGKILLGGMETRKVVELKRPSRLFY